MPDVAKGVSEIFLTTNDPRRIGETGAILGKLIQEPVALEALVKTVRTGDWQRRWSAALVLINHNIRLEDVVRGMVDVLAGVTFPDKTRLAPSFWVPPTEHPRTNPARALDAAKVLLKVSYFKPAQDVLVYVFGNDYQNQISKIEKIYQQVGYSYYYLSDGPHDGDPGIPPHEGSYFP